MNLNLQLRINSEGIVEDIFSEKDDKLNKEIQRVKKKFTCGKTCLLPKRKKILVGDY